MYAPSLPAQTERECAHPGALEASVICQGSSLLAKLGAPRVRGRSSPLPGWATPAARLPGCRDGGPLSPGVPTLPPGPPTCAPDATRCPSPPRRSRLPAPPPARALRIPAARPRAARSQEFRPAPGTPPAAPRPGPRLPLLIG